MLKEIAELSTPRLLMRQWHAADRPAFAAMNADPEVMAFFPALLDRKASDAMALRCETLIAERGWGFWALEEKGGASFIGFVGLHIPSAALPFSPCVEIGWRLDARHWGKGYATEAALAARDFAFSAIALDELVSFTTLMNHRSRAVMRRIGMIDSGENFKHPDIATANPLCEHCLYRMTRVQWQQLK